MWVELFLCLLLAHLIADFALQTPKSCNHKKENKWKSRHHYYHATVVFALSWLATFDIRFWWCALLVGISHLIIDIWKSYHAENIKWFVVDQLLHIAILASIAWLWYSSREWNIPCGLTVKHIAITVAIIACWKPANILIKLVLKHCSVNIPEADSKSGFNAGALIGDIERWLILIFVILQRYDAIGLLIAAKSIIRFGEKETTKTEYVLAGTLMSILIAVLAGLMVTIF